MDTQDALKILGLKAGASQDEVKSTYRILAKKWHPDLVLDPEQRHQAEQKIKEINQAYQVLKKYGTDGVANRVLATDPQPTDSIKVRTKPQDPKSFYRQAESYRRSGNLSEAIEACSQAIRLNRDYLDAYQLRHDILIELGYINRAASDSGHIHKLRSKTGKQQHGDKPKKSTKTIPLESDDPQFFYHRARAKLRNRKILEAIEDCTIAIGLNPEYIYAYRLRKSLYMRIGQSEAAALDDQQIISIQAKESSPGAEKDHPSKSERQQSKTSQYEDAQSSDSQVQQPENPHVNQASLFYNQALREFKQNLFQKALHNCNKAIRANPDYLEAYQLRRTICLSLNYLDRANFDTKQINRIKSQLENSELRE